MKCLVIMYINAESLMNDIEGILDFYQFKAIENNNCFRVFTGYFKGSVGKLADKLNKELEDAAFDVEDSIFIVYPVLSFDGLPSMTNLILKRKGNKYLRKKFIS
jgi:hypothetical protein